LDSGIVKHLLKLKEPFVRVIHAQGGFIYNEESRLVLADATDGKQIREFVINAKLAQFSVSANGEWLAVADDQGSLYCFEVKTGRLLNKSHEKIDSLTRMAVTDNGEYVYTTEFRATLRRWDTRRNQHDEMAEIRGQAASIFVSPDGRRIAIGGNHHDVGVYDAETRERIMYFQTESSDFYVTNVALFQDRLILTTDAGVLMDGQISPPTTAEPAPPDVNVTGTWSASFSGTVERMGTRQDDTFVMEIKQEGSRITGTLRFKGLDMDLPVSGKIVGTTFNYTSKAKLGPNCEASLAAETTIDGSSRKFKGTQTQTTCEGTAVGEVTAVRK